jgi:hypothetical protein
MRKIFFKFLKISILWPLTFYSDPALAYCGGFQKVWKILLFWGCEVLKLYF